MKPDSLLCLPTGAKLRGHIGHLCACATDSSAERPFIKLHVQSAVILKSVHTDSQPTVIEALLMAKYTQLCQVSSMNLDIDVLCASHLFSDFPGYF